MNMRLSILLVISLVILLGLTASASFAQVTPAGNPVALSSSTTSVQNNPPVVGGVTYSNGNTGGQVYVIKLKYLTPDEAMAILHDPKYKNFVPGDIMAIVGLEGESCLLVKAQGPEASMQLSQLLSLFDVPRSRYVVTATLLYTDTEAAAPTGDFTT